MALWKLIPSPSQNQKQKTDSIWDKDSDGDEHLGLKMEAPWEVSVLWGALRMSLHRHRRESKPQPCILTVAKCGGAASPSHTHKTGDCKRALSASCVFLCFSLLFSAVFVLSCCALLWPIGYLGASYLISTYFWAFQTWFCFWYLISFCCERRTYFKIF